MTSTAYKVACVQAAPEYFDMEAGVAKTVRLIEEAAQAGAKLIAFPECWIPGYPWWAWLDAAAVGMQFVPRHFNNCMTVDGPEVQAIAKAAMDNEIYVVLGYSEKQDGSLYIAQLHIDPWTQTITPRRKLKATHTERTIFGEGDGSDFFVRDTALGRVGSLCCWEHLNPLNKFAMYAQNEQIHIGAWPGFSLYAEKAYALGPELNTAVSQVYAAEGQCFVLAATALVTSEIQDMICDNDFKRELLPLGGGASRIFGPDGSSIGEPLNADEEGIIYADIDLDMISIAKAAADPSGHYSRPDVFRMVANKERRTNVEQVGDPDNSQPRVISIDELLDTESEVAVEAAE
ncbi:carbon-nitrogen hydrolase family protein [Parasphingorhabdus sp.]|uniref:carbon-nitrogen hydrolase family protein n=1 Tax=Parasphingorhabdus sp. TaxID=2709688 RepID=UPI003265E2AE